MVETLTEHIRAACLHRFDLFLNAPLRHGDVCGTSTAGGALNVHSGNVMHQLHGIRLMFDMVFRHNYSRSKTGVRIQSSQTFFFLLSLQFNL